jgi:hypothetical protein
MSEKDIKLLWGRAAGHCSKPGCGLDLTKEVEGGEDFVIGEMAHVIARSRDGPRGKAGAGDETYANRILLCPTHHRVVDKAPAGMFPAELLHAWKSEHEQRIREQGSERKFTNREDLAMVVRGLLDENHAIWKKLGPKSDIAIAHPISNAHKVWEARRVDRIVPNNRQIINVIRSNAELLTPAQSTAFGEFVAHAEAFEEHVYDRLDEYPLFPQSFNKAFTQ